MHGSLVMGLLSLVLLSLAAYTVKGSEEFTQCIPVLRYATVDLQCQHNETVMIYQAYLALLEMPDDCMNYTEPECKAWLPALTSKFNQSCSRKQQCSTSVAYPNTEPACSGGGVSRGAMLHVIYQCIFIDNETALTEFDLYPLANSYQLQSGVRANLRSEDGFTPLHQPIDCTVESDTNMTLRMDVLQLELSRNGGGYCVQVDEWTSCTTSTDNMDVLEIEMIAGEQTLINIQPLDAAEAWAQFEIVLTATTDCDGVCLGWMSVSCGGQTAWTASARTGEDSSSGLPNYYYMIIALGLFLVIVIVLHIVFIVSRKRRAASATNSQGSLKSVTSQKEPEDSQEETETSTPSDDLGYEETSQSEPDSQPSDPSMKEPEDSQEERKTSTPSDDQGYEDASQSEPESQSSDPAMKEPEDSQGETDTSTPSVDQGYEDASQSEPESQSSDHEMAEQQPGSSGVHGILKPDHQETMTHDEPVRKLSDSLEIMEDDLYNAMEMEEQGQQRKTTNGPKCRFSDDLVIIENDLYTTVEMEEPEMRENGRSPDPVSTMSGESMEKGLYIIEEAPEPKQ